MNHHLNERFTVEYIRREAYLILRYIVKRSKKSFAYVNTNKELSKMDQKILREWGIK